MMWNRPCDVKPLCQFSADFFRGRRLLLASLQRLCSDRTSQALRSTDMPLCLRSERLALLDGGPFATAVQASDTSTRRREAEVESERLCLSKPIPGGSEPSVLTAEPPRSARGPSELTTASVGFRTSPRPGISSI